MYLLPNIGTIRGILSDRQLNNYWTSRYLSIHPGHTLVGKGLGNRLGHQRWAKGKNKQTEKDDQRRGR